MRIWKGYTKVGSEVNDTDKSICRKHSFAYKARITGTFQQGDTSIGSLNTIQTG